MTQGRANKNKWCGVDTHPRGLSSVGRQRRPTCNTGLPTRTQWPPPAHQSHVPLPFVCRPQHFNGSSLHNNNKQQRENKHGTQESSMYRTGTASSQHERQVEVLLSGSPVQIPKLPRAHSVVEHKSRPQQAAQMHHCAAAARLHVPHSVRCVVSNCVEEVKPLV